ncbi:MAG: alpha amylase C-terminal domain-containing protein, partial [Acetomicrobium sp.]|nr:alpha amylase C-terminal domain-containing protein [Acetomicrobium sp.]
SDWESSVISFLRKSEKETVLVVCNFTPIPHYNYRIGVPSGGFWKEILNSDAKEYGGSGHGNFGGLEATPVPIHGRFYSLVMTLPPLSVIVFKKE